MTNRNNYLCVALPTALTEALVRTASQLGSMPEVHLGVPGVTFRPMAREDMHVTMLYCGEALRAVPADALKTLHAELAVLGARFDRQDLGLRVRGFELFPPGKQNLVTCHFTASEGLHTLQQGVAQAVANVITLPPGADEPWEPHATLGKIGASTAQLGGIRIALPPLAVEGFTPKGLLLSGQTLRQAWLDWGSDGLPFVPQDLEEEGEGEQEGTPSP